MPWIQSPLLLLVSLLWIILHEKQRHVQVSGFDVLLGSRRTTKHTGSSQQHGTASSTFSSINTRRQPPQQTPALTKQDLQQRAVSLWAILEEGPNIVSSPTQLLGTTTKRCYTRRKHRASIIGNEKNEDIAGDNNSDCDTTPATQTRNERLERRETTVIPLYDSPNMVVTHPSNSTAVVKKSYTRRKNRPMAIFSSDDNNHTLVDHDGLVVTNQQGARTTLPINQQPQIDNENPDKHHDIMIATMTNDDKTVSTSQQRWKHHGTNNLPIGGWTSQWRASYRMSCATQNRIKEYALKKGNNDAHAILEYFLSLDPRQCNVANVVCAVTLAAKALLKTSPKNNPKNDESNFNPTATHHRVLIRNKLSKMLAIVEELLLKNDQHTLSVRQLANLVWGLAKFYDYDPTLQPLNRWNEVSYDGTVVESWNIASASIHHRTMDGTDDGDDVVAALFSNIVDSIAMALTKAIREKPNTVKTQELCMTCWAYGVLRRRRRPTGWRTEPSIGTLPRSDETRKKDLSVRSDDIIDFYGFEDSDSEANDDEVPALTPVDMLLDEIALTFSNDPERIKSLHWKELANVVWAYATIGHRSNLLEDNCLGFWCGLSKEATDRLRNDTMRDIVQSRDLAQIVWSLGVLQSDNLRLADGYTLFVDAVAERIALGKGIQDVSHWSCADIVQTALSLAHARLDEQDLLLCLYNEATTRLLNNHFRDYEAMQIERKSFYMWELSILLWIQARLYLTEQLNATYSNFTIIAMAVFSNLIKEGHSLASFGIGSQERANIAWSIAVLDCSQYPSVQYVLRQVFGEACTECQENNGIQLDHAHQLWQALTLLEPSCPQCFTDIPTWFRSYLDHQWKVEKARPKQSSARHNSLSKILDLMGVAHYNEHDEDIDVAIILKPFASWTHETVKSEMPNGVKVAVEFDGPLHFTRERHGLGPPRTLGHTVLKYRLLKQSGWTVVRVPYYEFDRIPFWASMERQRYVQRLLKTHGNLRFSHVDVSEYKTHVPNRSSRFD